jgi:hypothetical protein
MTTQKQLELNAVDTPLEFGKFVFFSFSGILVVMLGLYVYRFGITTSTSQSTWGAFGDFLGGTLNPLVSFLTLIVAVNVWRLQKRELEYTRTALEAQGKIAETQRKEQRFYDLLNLYRNTLVSVEYQYSTETERRVFKGKQAFAHFTSGKYSNPLKNIGVLCNNEDSDAVPYALKVKELNWSKESSMLDHYFRVVFSILREAKPTLDSESHRYIKLFRAQLSRDEVCLITANLLFDEEGMKMRDLVAQYGLLKHLPKCPLRELAERELTPGSFGSKWLALHSSNV